MGITILSPVPPTPTLYSTVPNADALVGLVGTSAQASPGDHVHPFADSGWLTPALLNGWTVYGDGNFGIAAVYRRIDGIVYLRGLLVSSSASSGVAFNLPVGYRPANVTRLFGGFADNGANRYDIQVSGDVLGPTGRAWVSFAGIVFPAEV